MSTHCPVTPALVAGVILASVAAAQGAHAQATVMGWTSATRTTVDSGNGRPAEVSASREVWAGGRARMETYIGSDSVAPMSIVLMDSATKTMTSIMAPQHLAMVMGIPPGIMEGFTKEVRYGRAGKNIFHTDTLGEGPLILGHPTRHFVDSLHIEMRVSGRGFACTRTTDSRTDRYATTDSIGPVSHRGRWWEAAIERSTGHAHVADSVRKAKAKSHALPLQTLRSETVSVTSGRGAPVQVKTTEETTAWSYGPVDASLFAPPAGFRVMDYRTISAGIDQKKLAEAFAPGLEKSLCGAGSH